MHARSNNMLTTMLFYLFPATVVFVVVLDALLKDTEFSNKDWEAWAFIFLAAMFWPITLPSIIRKKYLDWRDQSDTNTQVWVKLH